MALLKEIVRGVLPRRTFDAGKRLLLSREARALRDRCAAERSIEGAVDRVLASDYFCPDQKKFEITKLLQLLRERQPRVDHDDFFERADHLSVGVKALTQADADYYFTHVRLEPAHPSLVGFTPPEKLASCPAILDDPTVREVPLADFLRVMRHHHIHPSHSITRRDLLERVGGFIEGLKTFDDINLMFRVADRVRGGPVRGWGPASEKGALCRVGPPTNVSYVQGRRTLARCTGPASIRSARPLREPLPNTGPSISPEARGRRHAAKRRTASSFQSTPDPTRRRRSPCHARPAGAPRA